MIEKESTIDRMTIGFDGIITIVERISFIEDGKVVGESLKTSRTLYPGDTTENEPQKIKDIIAIVHTEEVLSKYKQEQLRKTMGYEA